VALKSLDEGDEIVFDDGALRFKVAGKKGDSLLIKAEDGYILKNAKSVNIPEKFIDTPSLVEKDLLSLEVATRKKVDFVALSFVRNAKDVKILQGELRKRNITAQVIAKIENRPALNNIEEIVEVSDGIMIARGDLGVEVPLRELAFWQKKIIYICRDANKPVIVATQMLKSMTESSTPTRAEATDIANAVFDGADALMLSEETAIGKYPVKAVKEMASIARFSERQGMIHKLKMEIKDGTEAIVEAVFNILNRSKHVNIDAVIVFTESGYTARAMSAHRPNTPMIAITNNVKTRDYLTLTSGVETYVVEFPEGNFDFSKLPIDVLFKKKLLKKGSVVLATHGRRWNEPGATSVVGLFKV
jgi:pyruvate kinase